MLHTPIVLHIRIESTHIRQNRILTNISGIKNNLLKHKKNCRTLPQVLNMWSASVLYQQGHFLFNKNVQTESIGASP